MMEYALLANVACSVCGFAMEMYHHPDHKERSETPIACGNGSCKEYQIKYRIAKIPLEKIPASGYLVEPS